MTEAAAPALYLRFGELPASRRSANWRGEPGSTLCGVSCFKARRTADGEVEVDVSSGLELALVFYAFSAKPLPALLIEGREVGVGNCGEVLLADVKLVERLTPRPRIRTSGLPWLLRLLGTPKRREAEVGEEARPLGESRAG